MVELLCGAAHGRNWVVTVRGACRWVPAFLEQILAARKKEEAHVMKELKMFGWIITAVIVTPQFATMLTYLAFTLPSNVALNAPDAFAGLALFNILRFPLMKLGDAVTRWVACTPRLVITCKCGAEGLCSSSH
jgi:hypothetical protein